LSWSVVDLDELPRGMDAMAANHDPKFDPDCFWYRPLGANPPVNPRSADLVNRFLNQLTPTNNAGNAAINTCQWTAPVYIANPTDPQTAVTVNKPDGWCPALYDSLVKQFKSVPIPKYAKPSPDKPKEGPPDNQMAIYDPNSDALWEFYQAVNTNGAWQIGGGGQMTQVSQNKDGFFPSPFGATATCLALAGGQITAEELEPNGPGINHVMGIALTECAAGTWSWPAQKTDGKGPATGIPQGLRFYLPASALEKLKLSPVAMIIAKAAVNYGFVVWDNAGTISLRCKNPYSYTLPPGDKPNPYPALFDSDNQWNVLAGFPWEEIRFLPCDYRNP
jgi:hypothetical protein